MEKGLIGRKLGMTQIFAADGNSVPVTVIEAGPCVVIQKKTEETDGYNAIQLGFDRKRQKNVTKPLQGHFAKADRGFFRVLREFKTQAAVELEPGQELTASIFAVGDFVDVTGTSKGRGFAGGVKRHGFRGGKASHGSMFHRAPGSIGASAYPSRVVKGMRSSGRLGGRKATAKNLTVVRVDAEKNLIYLSGAVPGARRSLVKIVRSTFAKPE